MRTIQNLHLSELEVKTKATKYQEVIERIEAILDGEIDDVAALATVACELHAHFDYFDWTGFYRVTAPDLLTIGPYQGGHGCLRIPFGRGVCGTAAVTGETQRIDDVNSISNHIACSTLTSSEIVVPICNARNEIVAVLDVDSNQCSAFDHDDQEGLEWIAKFLSRFYP